MRSTTFIMVLLYLASSNASAQCNGDLNTCSKPYDEVAYLTAHNAYNAQGYTFPNQNFGLTQQLNDGVRGLMLDVYDLFGTTMVYHGSSLLGSETLNSNLLEVEQFLASNPNEIVTIILECYVSANTIESELTAAGLYNYLYSKPISSDWATLQEMINSNKRLVIFTDVQDASASQGWYHYAWDHAVETHYTVNSLNDFNNTYNRGDAWNDLFIFNHFVTDATLGIGQESIANIVNEYSFLSQRIQQHYAEKNKFPNFITLDFYDVGDGKDVVDSLNAGSYFAKFINMENSEFVLFPNPAKGTISISGLKVDPALVTIMNQMGEVVLQKELHSDFNVINITGLPKGMYSLIISRKNATPVYEKLIVN